MASRTSRFLSIVLVLCMIISMMPAVVSAASIPSVLYLKPNSNWLVDGARFAAYFFGSSGNTWVSMTDSNSDGYYEVSVPSGYSSVIFCRMNSGATENNWDNKWNQTDDLTIPTDGKNCYTVKDGTWDKGGGSWSTRTVTYYLFGYINGANYACEDDSANIGTYKFVDGKLTTTFKSNSYVGVKTGDNGSWYMTEGYNAAATKVTLYNTASGINEPDKMFVPGGVEVTFTLTANSDGTLTLGYTVNPDTCNHSYDAGTVTSEPTCVALGTKTFTCKTCAHTYIEEIAELGHSYESKVIAPTCTEDGYTLYTCNACGDSYQDAATEATGHSYENGICTKCGDGCDHSYTSVTANPTCTESGRTVYTCSKCVSSYTETIAALGHSWTNGVCGTCGEKCSHSYSGGLCTICGVKVEGVIVHLVNTLGWNGVVAHAWEGTTSTAISGYEWPGQIVQRDAEGYFTLNVDYEPAAGKTLGLLFHDFNGNQTADIEVDYATLNANREIWIKPSTTANSEGKYPCAVATGESGLVISPEINGTSVTFRYQNASASGVYLAGSMNNWSTSANKMTKGSDGVWSITLNLDPGVYEYKFVADGEWITDPANGVAGGYDGNSMLVVSSDDEIVNTGKINVVLHFYKSGGNYTGWDVWFWGNEKSGAATFQTMEGDKGVIATFTVDGNTNSNVGYIVRKTDWSDKEFGDRFIDLSDVASGTVHYYVNSGVAAGSRVLGEDVVSVGKLAYANYDYNAGKVWVKAALPLAGANAGAFSIVDGDGKATNVTVTGVELGDGGYTLTLSRGLTLGELNSYQVKFGNYYATISINTHDLFYSAKFAQDYTYNGDDLGATWSANSTTFKVWAPTAKAVSVKLYKSGNYGANDLIKTVAMAAGEKGVWYVTVSGDLNGVYYNYDVTFATYTKEATDPYARATGANGDRGMVINLDSTDPEGWDGDISPNQGMSYTDAIIYEMHVREMTIDSSSGVKAAWRGKYLGLTQSGTSYNGYATGLDHLKELGVTHVQLMPVFDFSSADEYHLTDWAQYAWGYDPRNYNVPEGSYSTDPFKGEVRINEFKQMVQTFHENGINVVMDVVYNHTFDGGNFCGNQIVPNYYSRFYGEGNWSNGSGCGNDLATERTMVRNMIVDSILYWVEEYHIDGFRFDLLGLIDVTTANEIANTVHAKYPYVMFYGEGWAAGGTAVEYGNDLTTQGNAWQVGGFGFFNDTFRNAIAGDNGHSWGFASGSGDFADTIAKCFRASNGWSTSPTQTINYVSCHDNYCLTDKLCISRNGAYWSELAAMNRLANAIVMLSQGTPFIYSGDEMLREKKDANGNRYDNAYGTDDYINKIRWSELQTKDYAQITDDYYGGLIEFRKNHAALRCPSGADAWNYVTYHKIDNNCILLYVNGYPNYECSDGICIILNGSGTTKSVDIYNKVPAGYWQACIHGDKAGTDALWGMDVTSSSGNVGVEPYSATVLVLGDLVHEESVYNNQPHNCEHASHTTSGLCTKCGSDVAHTYSGGKCSVCGLAENAPATYTVYYDNATTKWSAVNVYAWTTVGSRTVQYTGNWPGAAMTHVGDGIYSFELPIGATNVIFNDGGSNQTDDLKAPGYTSGLNMYSGKVWTTYQPACSHDWADATCTAPKTCTLCGETEGDALGHSYENGSCTVCGEADPNYNPVVQPSFNVLSKTLNLEGEVKYNMIFMANNTASVKNMGLITFLSNPSDVSIDSADYVIPGAVSASGMYMVGSQGIPAKNLGDTLYMVIYAKLTDGSYAYSGVVPYSAKDYAYAQLGSSGITENQRKLLVAMLNYGAEAQLAFGYNTDNLINADLAAMEIPEMVTYSNDLLDACISADDAKTGNFPTGGFYMNSATVSLEGALAINYLLMPANTPANGMKVYYWTAETYNSVDALTVENADGTLDSIVSSGMYMATYNGLAASQMGDTVYVAAVYENGGNTYTTGVISYSLAKYLTATADGTGEQKNLAAATVIYGYYANIEFPNV